MTPILKKQLTLLCCAAVLLGALILNGRSLRAQNADKEAKNADFVISHRIKLTRDEAALNFAALLQYYVYPSSRVRISDDPDSFDTEPSDAMISSVSRKSETEIAGILLGKMMVQWAQTKQKAAIAAKTHPAPLPFVLIQEGDSWGVDLFETYCRWNGLEGDAKTKALASLVAENDLFEKAESRDNCQSNLRAIMLGLSQYAQDNDDKFLPAKRWEDVVKPYVENKEVFKCPSVAQAKGYGYAYNARLSNKRAGFLPRYTETISFYETTDLKRNAYGMGEKLDFRHLEGANYAFADGHVKWFAKSKVPSFKLKS